MMMQKAGFEPVDQKRRSTVNLFEKVRSPSDEVEIDGDAVAQLRSFSPATGKKYLFSWPFTVGSCSTCSDWRGITDRNFFSGPSRPRR